METSWSHGWHCKSQQQSVCFHFTTFVDFPFSRINAEVQELQNEGVPQDEAEMLDQFLEMFKLPFQEVIGEVGTFEGAPSCEPVSPGKVLAVPLNLETDSVEFSETRDRPQVVHSNDSVEGVVHVDRDLCIEEANRLDPPRTPQLETSPVLRFVQSYERLTRTYDILDGATTWSSLDIEFQSASSHSPGFIDVLTNEQWSGLLDLASQRILRVRDTCLFEGESLSNAVRFVYMYTCLQSLELCFDCYSFRCICLGSSSILYT